MNVNDRCQFGSKAVMANRLLPIGMLDENAMVRRELAQFLDQLGNSHGFLPKSLATNATIDAAHTPRPKPRAMKIRGIAPAP